MKRIITASILLIIGLSQATAQSVYRSNFNDGYFNNWFIGAGAGPQLYYGDHDKQADVKDRLSLGYQFYVGNWFTPDIGARVSFDGFKVKGLTQDQVSHSTGELYNTKDRLYKQEFGYYKIQADVIFNIMNYFYSYEAKRFYSFIPYAGIGYMATTDAPKESGVSFNLGAMNSFRISDSFNLVIDVRGNLVGDKMDGERGGRKLEGMFNSTLGLTYRFR